MSLSILYVRAGDTPARLSDTRTDVGHLSVTVVSSAAGALDALSESSFDCVVAEAELDGDSGLDVLGAVRSERPSVPFVLCSETPDGELASEATRYDVSAYHVHGSDEPLAERVVSVVTDDSTDGATPPGARGDGRSVTHGTPFTSIAETLNAAVVTIDSDSTIHFANAALATLTGYDHEDLVGDSFTKVMPERFRAAHHAAIQQYAETRERTLDWDYIELAVERRDGTEVPVAVSFSEFERDGDLFFTGVLRDITDRKAYTEALSTLHETTQDLFAASSPGEVAERTVQALSEAIGHDITAVRLFDPDEGILRPVALTDQAERTIGDRPVYEAGEWGPGEAFESGEVVVYHELQERAAETAAGPDPDEVAGVEQTMYVPLEDHGVVSVGTAESGGFDERSRSLVELLASNVTAALDRVEREQELVTYETVLESVQGMVYVLDADGTFSLVTDPLAEWLGYDRSRMNDIDPSDVVDPEVLPEFQAKIEELWHSDAESVTIEADLRAANGTVYPAEVEVSLYPTDGPFRGTIGVVRDRSDLKAARQQLATERDRFTYLFNTMPDAVVEVVFEDDVPIVESTNQAFETVFGYDEEAVVGQSVNDLLLPDEEFADKRNIDERLANQEEWTGEVRRQTAEGLRYFLFRGVPYQDDDGAVRAFCIYTDITERKTSERRLQVLSRVLRHNLRNDLTVILGHAGDLASSIEDDALRRRALALREKVEAVSRMSERARDIQRTLDDGGGPQQTVAFRAYLERLLEDQLPADPDGRVDLHVSPSLSVLVDKRLDLAVENLVENALVHGDDRPQVRVTAEAADEDLVIRVADDGPGIPDTEWDIVSGDAEVTQLSHGSGLGLWAVRWVVESYGGRLERRASDLGGDEVRLKLPGLVV